MELGGIGVEMEGTIILFLGGEQVVSATVAASATLVLLEFLLESVVKSISFLIALVLLGVLDLETGSSTGCTVPASYSLGAGIVVGMVGGAVDLFLLGGRMFLLCSCHVRDG